MWFTKQRKAKQQMRIWITLLALFSSIAFVSIKANAEQQKLPETVLQDKYYRQALYYYFQGDYVRALSLLEHAELTFNGLTKKGLLFKAGLQVAQGLQQQGQQSLEKLVYAQQYNLQNNKATSIKPSAEKNSEAQELFVVTLLALSEQYIEQGKQSLAQQTLQQIRQVPPHYYGQYQLLSQLAYWPDTPKTIIEPLVKPQQLEQKTIDANEQYSPYIELNKALAFIEQKNYTAAIAILHNFKALSIASQHKKSFWSNLFLWFDDKKSQNNQVNDAQSIEQQALEDYARLLFAQIYVGQKNYDEAFLLLENFPQKSLYAESALFLFALASQEVKQYTMALNLFALLYQKYPYSPLGWQSAALLAKQISQQKSLAHGLKIYQDIEQFYLQQLAKLKRFKYGFDHHDDLLTFATTAIKVNEQTLAGITQQKNLYDTSAWLLINAPKHYQSQNIWLQKALGQAQLKNAYQQLSDLKQLTASIDVLKIKLSELQQIITLNKQRNKKLLASFSAQKYHDLIMSFIAQRDNLSAILNAAKQQQNADIFADKLEQKWLGRIEKSRQHICEIKTFRETEDYEKRLNRVAGVLAWQLQQQYPQRLWQHQKQLNVLNNDLKKLVKQQQQVLFVSQNQPLLTNFSQRYQQLQQQITLLQQQVSQKRANINSRIRSLIADYVTEQQSTLQRYLLNARREMANILEQMSAQDKKIIRQLRRGKVNKLIEGGQ